MVMLNNPAPQDFEVIPLPPMSTPQTQVLPEFLYDLQVLSQLCLENSCLTQSLHEAIQGTSDLAFAVKEQCIELSQILKEEETAGETQMMLTLYERIPVFSYYIQAIPEVKRIMFKRRQLR